MSERNVNLDFDRMIHEARMQRTAAIGNAIVSVATAVSHWVKKIIGLQHSVEASNERQARSHRAAVQG